MRGDVLALALIVGAFTWAFRSVPLRMALHAVRPGSALGRFLGGTGAAAIATLFVAEILPYLRRMGAGGGIPLIIGVASVLVVYGWRRSVVQATLAGALSFGLASWAVAV